MVLCLLPKNLPDYAGRSLAARVFIEVAMINPV